MTVTCVIATHARPEMLTDSLTSVLAQTRPPEEVIVVDDLGDPTAAAVVNGLQPTTSATLKYMARSGNPGASASRNAGAAEASGDVLTFLDDDDVWHANFLEQLLPPLEQGSAELAIGSLTAFCDGLVAPPKVVAEGLQTPDVIDRNPGVTGSNFAITKRAFQEVAGFDEHLRVSNDKDLFVRTLLAGVPYASRADAVAYQRIHTRTERLTHSNPMRVKALEEYRDKWSEVLSPQNRKTLDMYILKDRYRCATNLIGRFFIVARLLVRHGPSSLRREAPKSWVTPSDDAPIQISHREGPS